MHAGRVGDRHRAFERFLHLDRIRFRLFVRRARGPRADHRNGRRTAQPGAARVARREIGGNALHDFAYVFIGRDHFAQPLQDHLQLRRRRQRADRLDRLALDRIVRRFQLAQDRRHRGRIGELRQRADRHRRCLVVFLEQRDDMRHRLLVAEISQRVDGAFAHPPVGVLERLHQVAERALVLGGVENLHRGAAHELVVVAEDLQHGVDHFGPADRAERIGGAHAHPPVLVLQREQEILDRVGVADGI